MEIQKIFCLATVALAAVAILSCTRIEEDSDYDSTLEVEAFYKKEMRTAVSEESFTTISN